MGVEVGRLERWVEYWLRQAVGKRAREKFEGGSPGWKSEDASLRIEV